MLMDIGPVLEDSVAETVKARAPTPEKFVISPAEQTCSASPVLAMSSRIHCPQESRKTSWGKSSPEVADRPL